MNGEDDFGPLHAEIIACYAALTEAITLRDGAALDRLVAEDFVFTSERGRWGKQSFIARDILRMDPYDVLVRDLAGIAAMHARVRLAAALDGHEVSSERLLTDLWMRRGGPWRLVARQWSRAEADRAN